MGSQQSDEVFIEAAIRLARRGDGRTSPNPRVGAVIVNKGRVVGTGWHKGAGKPHAEAEAIADAGTRASGGTIYSNLEPCAHYGRTPPCARAIAEAGIERAVISMRDPDPISGDGIRILRRAGVKVELGLREEAAKVLNEDYIVHRTRGRPFVTYKSALTLDGRTSAADGSSKWITGPPARADVHRLRGRSDAVCVGVGTILVDDPSLTVREARARRVPVRLVIDSKARTPLEARILSDEAPTWVVVSTDAPATRVRRLEKVAKVLVIPSGPGGVSIPSLLSNLGAQGIVALLLEGGPTLAGSFQSEGFIDKYVLYYGPKLMGALGTKGAIENWGAGTIEAAPAVTVASVRKVGDDIRVTAYPGS